MGTNIYKVQYIDKYRILYHETKFYVPTIAEAQKVARDILADMFPPGVKLKPVIQKIGRL